MVQEANNRGESLTVADHSVPLAVLRAALLSWWKEHGRNFPWRSTTSPFHMLMAEMMLRRTQARQVIPVYSRFVEQYPDAQALADAPVNAVADVLYSLGLAWRVPAFQQLAIALVNQYDGKVPAD